MYWTIHRKLEMYTHQKIAMTTTVCMQYEPSNQGFLFLISAVFSAQGQGTYEFSDPLVKK